MSTTRDWANGPFIARKERNGWLLLNVVTHRITVATSQDLQVVEDAGLLLRRIEAPLVVGAMSAPLKLFISVSDRCNLSCMHCMSSSSPQGRIEPSEQQLLDLADEAAAMGIFLAIIGGGEPMLRRETWALIERLRSHHMGVSLTTNGTILTNAMMEDIKRHQVRLNVSIDGAEATHDRIRGHKGTYRRTIANLRRLIAEGIKPTIRYTLMRSNLADVECVLALSRELGIPLKVRRAKPSGRILEKSEIITAPTAEYLHAVTVLNQAGDCGVEDLMTIGRISRDPLLLSDTDCGAGTRVMFVDADGSITPCTFLGSDFVAGRWTPGTLADFWHNAPQFKTMRNLTLNSSCASCARARVCHAECPAMRLHVGGSLDAQDPGCILPLDKSLRRKEK